MIDPRKDRELEELEAALRQELRTPVPLPPGFQARTLHRVATREPAAAAASAASRPFRWQAFAAAAALVAVLGGAGGIWQGRQVKREASAHAQRQFILALHITGSSLRSAGQRVDLQLARNAAKADPSQTFPARISKEEQ